METNIPPHNLGELVDVLCVLIQNPEATVRSQIYIILFFESTYIILLLNELVYDV